MREKAVWLTEGVTLSGALRGGTVCGHTLESAILAAEGVRMQIQISQAKGQSKRRMIFSVIWRYAGFQSTVLPGKPAFLFSQGGRFLNGFFSGIE